MIIRRLAGPFAIAALLLVSTALAKRAADVGAISPDVAFQIMRVATGAILAFFGVRILAGSRSVCGPAVAVRRAQSAARVSGWAFVVAGLTDALLGAVSASPIAVNAGLIVVLAATILTIGSVGLTRGAGT